MKVAFQGDRGAYSEMACYKYFPSAETLPCKEFDHAFDAVEQGTVDAAVIPIDNSTMGGVYRVYELLLERNLVIIGETFVPITHCLLSKGTNLAKIRRVYSHPQALGQCKAFLDSYGIEAVATYDTAGAAKELKPKISLEIIDLISINPIDYKTILASVEKTKRLLILDLSWKTAGISSTIANEISYKMFGKLKAPVEIITIPDYPTPTAEHLEKSYYPTIEQIHDTCLKLIK